MTAAAPARARTATVVVVGPPPRLSEGAALLQQGDTTGALHIVLVSTGPEPPADVGGAGDVVAIAGLRDEYVDNAIAGVRLSSLPTVVWWRGGTAAGLERVAVLADRLVLDVEDPRPLWSRAPALFEETALTDLRWARLTRWRGAMAHFFDLPDVRAIAPTFSTLAITGHDTHQCALFAGWLDSSLGWNGRVQATITRSTAAAPMQEITLGGPEGQLALRLLPNTTCLDTEARAAARTLASRVISLGDQTLAALMSEELRVRSRDLAFERALQSPLTR